MKRKSNVYIIGASGLGREIESWLSLSSDFTQTYSVKGYLDDDPEVLNNYPTDFKLLGSIDEFRFGENDFALIAIADPLVKKDIVNRLKDKVRFLSFIYHNSIIGKNVRIGEGTFIGPNCVLTSNVSVGSFVTIIIGTIIGHDSIVSDYSSLMAQVNISGNVRLGNSVYIGSNSTVLPGKKVGDNSKISAGSTVFNDLPENSFAFGNPAKKITKFFK
ncbi:MAG TPA: NeuD/PglB/VioB family sugar acetyltransferase [Bacteroidales bacterium]|nr:NeuD/PglB/VioB family sugar acetyltransferase [Bacteroidales bacterium]HQK68430.1 NeuD/PglB/VioB family sugar acetyltransferase [Bacteroidales bacterium]